MNNELNQQADKIARATKYIVESQRKSFKDHWEDEINGFINELSDKHLDKISYLHNPDDLLDQLEYWITDCDDEDEEECDADFNWIAMNLRLQRKCDQDQMLQHIVERANNRD